MFEIGSSLREARTRRSIDFVQAEQATKIRARYLRALEDERFDELPSQTYVKGFLRTYADYLGLDGQLYVDEFNSRFVAGDDHDARPRRSSVRPERRTRRLETGIVLVAVALVAVVTLVVVGAWQIVGIRLQDARHLEARQDPQEDRDLAPERLPSDRGSDRQLLRHRPPRRPGRQAPLQGTVEKGHLEPFTGKYFWVSVSSPENLRITVAGKRVEIGGYKPVAFTVNPSGVHSA